LSLDATFFQAANRYKCCHLLTLDTFHLMISLSSAEWAIYLFVLLLLLNKHLSHGLIWMTTVTLASNLIKCAQFSIWSEDNIIFTYSVGVWGQSNAERFCREYTHIRKPLLGRPWAVISHSKNWVLGTPEIEPVIATLSLPEDNIGLAAVARIINGNALTQFQMKNIIRNAKNDQLRRNFIDETAAFNWLKEQGFCPSTSSFEGCPNI
jgi:hypothetical protein